MGSLEIWSSSKFHGIKCQNCFSVGNSPWLSLTISQITHTDSSRIVGQNETSFPCDGTNATFRVMFKEPVEIYPNMNYTAACTLKGICGHWAICEHALQNARVCVCVCVLEFVFVFLCVSFCACIRAGVLCLCVSFRLWLCLSVNFCLSLCLPLYVCVCVCSHSFSIVTSQVPIPTTAPRVSGRSSTRVFLAKESCLPSPTLPGRITELPWRTDKSPKSSFTHEHITNLRMKSGHYHCARATILRANDKYMEIEPT